MDFKAFKLPAAASLRRLLPVLEQRLPFWVSVLLVLLIAWTLARLTWELLPQPKSATLIYKPMATSASQPNAFGQLADMHLFGTVNAAGVNAPETTLALSLRGIVAADSNHQESRAIIAANGNEQTYGIGAQLPGGAVIQSIYPDRVMLSLDGRLETLSLPKADTSGVSGNTALPPLLPSVVYGANLPPTGNLSQLRNELVNHPEKLLDIVRAMPVMANGKLVGYRVFPVGNSSAFAQFGLEAGDVVTAVNGMPLDNPAESMRILGNLKTSDQISITLTRNGQQQTQVLQLQNPNN